VLKQNRLRVTVFGVGMGLKHPKVVGVAAVIGWFAKVVGAANDLFFLRSRTDTEPSFTKGRESDH
jgi:deoxyinosine 3'endonuclease (endonuclease V)